MSQKSSTARPTGSHRFTQKQGQYLAFIYVCAHIFHQLPAEADMQRHFRVTPPRSIRWSLASNATASSHDSQA
jgi:hypothetical protein